MELPPRTGKIEIHYDGLSFQAPEKVRFRYRLEGFEASWVDAGTRRSAFYTSLPPGDFVFRVVAANNDGVWNETGARFAFRLKPGLHQRLGFRVGAVAVLLLVVGTGYALRMRGVRARHTELQRLVDERTRSLVAEIQRAEELRRQSDGALGEARGGEPGQEPVPREHEPRAPDAAERHPRLRRAPGGASRRSRRARGRSRTSGRSAAREATSSSSSATSSTSRRSRRAGWRSSPRPFVVAEVVEETARTVRQLVEANRNRLVVTVDPEVGRMTSDAFRLKQVLFNLLSNAGKFTQDGTVELSVRRERGRGADLLVFRVADTGIGMSVEQLEKVFTPFVQGDASLTRRFGGTGLGLALSQHLARVMGGGISVTSAEGQGTTFFVELPAEAPAPRPAVTPVTSVTAV